MISVKLRCCPFSCIPRKQVIRFMHRVSQIYQPLTLEPVGSKPKKATAAVSCRSHQLMSENGLIRSASPGTYHYLPLGQKSLSKLIKLIDCEMTGIGNCQRVELSTLIAQSLLQATGRWFEMESELFQLKDRQERTLCLGPTHEESITALLGSAQRLSYKRLPIRLYQVTKKYRDEPRPKLGLLRAKEFLMKDLYSFDSSIENARTTYDQMCRAYASLFTRLGLTFVRVKAGTGNIGGELSHEYHLPSNIGEDKFLYCPSCEDGANIELNDGKTCEKCRAQLQLGTGIEVGHCFLLGTKYSKPLEATFYNEQGKESYFQMGCYGLGVSRILAASIEVLSTETEIRYPKLIAPYTICIIPPKRGSKEEAATSMATHLYEALSSELFPHDVIYDDRTQLSIGERLALARRAGHPYVIVTGKMTLNSRPQIEFHDVYAGMAEFLTHSQLFHRLRNISLASNI